MILLPAIDMYENKVVRLERGDYGKMTVYSEDPVGTAKGIEAAGARWLHVVDLEGAENGCTPSFETIRRICRQTALRVEVGGGVRSMETIERYLSAGVSRVILGTKAVTDRAFLAEVVARFADGIAVGVDIRDGSIAIKGWKELAQTPVDRFFEELCALGVQTVICTDVSKDGMMAGTNLELYRNLAARYPLNLIASGGVSSYEDIRALRGLGLYGAILGKAMYLGAVDLRQALKLAEE